MKIEPFNKNTCMIAIRMLTRQIRKCENRGDSAEQIQNVKNQRESYVEDMIANGFKREAAEAVCNVKLESRTIRLDLANE